ncbi:glycosyltransferase family 2 protein [Halobacteriovorax sp.]|uniref:glycosyltransferase family 2 protein n=1 Tax=Halobacteriovorax sp. TaxID=2020862 RepID=UPI003564C72C
MKYSILIVTYDRADLLQKCISEIRHQAPEVPILVGINGNDPKSSQYLQNISQVTFKSFPKMTPGEVRNELIKLVETPWICFLDDDIIPCEDYFKIAQGNIELKSLDIFGGPDTSYPNESRLEAAISLALTSPLATAHSRKRHVVSNQFKSDATEQDLILCNLWMKTSIFHKEKNSFDSRFFRNEENVLLNKLLKEGKTTHYYGNLFVHHKRKSNLFHMIFTVMKSANFRMKSFLFYPNSFQPIYLVPSIAFLYLVYIALFPSVLLSIPLFIYLISLITLSWKICSKEKRMNLFFQVILIQGLINLSYGIGFISPPRPIK